MLEPPSINSTHMGRTLGFYLSLQFGCSWAPCASKKGSGVGVRLLPPSHPDEIEPRPVFEKKPLMWEEDLELYSRFLDRKVKRRCSPGSHSPPPFPAPDINSTDTDHSSCPVAMHSPGGCEVSVSLIPPWSEVRGFPGRGGRGSGSGSVPTRSSCASATPGTCSSIRRPRRSSPTSCSSCCCASRPTWSPSPPSTSAPSRRAGRPPLACAPPTGPAPSA